MRMTIDHCPSYRVPKNLHSKCIERHSWVYWDCGIPAVIIDLLVGLCNGTESANEVWEEGKGACPASFL